jgi:hypothetical protein
MLKPVRSVTNEHRDGHLGGRTAKARIPDYIEMSLPLYSESWVRPIRSENTLRLKEIAVWGMADARPPAVMERDLVGCMARQRHGAKGKK